MDPQNPQVMEIPQVVPPAPQIPPVVPPEVPKNSSSLVKIATVLMGISVLTAVAYFVGTFVSSKKVTVPTSTPAVISIPTSTPSTSEFPTASGSATPEPTVSASSKSTSTPTPSARLQ